MRPSTPSIFLTAVAACTCSCFFLVMITQALEQRKQEAPHDEVGATCIPIERDALLAFKRGITSDPDGRLTSWREGGGDCCRWNGVLCSNHTGHVLSLQLRSKQCYYGAYGSSCTEVPFAPMVGHISHSLLSLEYLEHLDLSGNSLSGPTGRVPDFLGALRNLKYLSLSGIPFYGRLTPHLGNLSNLQYLDLSYSGVTHIVDLAWLTKLQHLQYLNLSGVNLTAIDDWPRAVNMIPSLRVLEVSKCSITRANQSLPGLNLTNLEKLDLSDNPVDHPITSCWFWNIKHLKHLDLGSTGLYGPLPEALQSMTYLQYLDISQLPYGGKANCIMTTSLKNFCNLEFLYMQNNLLYGDITDLLPYCSTNKLRELDLSRNNISGELPNRLWPFTSLRRLYLPFNHIGGRLPNWMGQLTSLEELHLSFNHISGVVPDWIGQLSSLKFLDLLGNNISGVLPNSMGQLTSLESLDLSSNNIDGILPNQMARLTSLAYLDLNHNNITGPLPSFVGNFTRLNYLDLSHNHLTGHVPFEISMLSDLEELKLNNNYLDGTITEKHFASLQSLELIDLSYNPLNIQISSARRPRNVPNRAFFASCQIGPLFPSWLKEMVEIVALDISNTGLNDRLPDWFCTTFSSAEYLNISNNRLHGGLPANMENMSLQQLFLGSNQLTGPVPPMPISLTTLDLSRNLLSGPLQ